MSSSTFTMKATLGDDTRRLSATREDLTTREGLCAVLASRFKINQAALRIKWVDDEGDQITIGSDADLAEALAGDNKLRLMLSLTDDAAPSEPSAEPSAEPQPSMAAVPQGVFGLFGGMQGRETEALHAVMQLKQFGDMMKGQMDKAKTEMEQHIWQQMQSSEAHTHVEPFVAHLKEMGEKMRADFEEQVVPQLKVVGEKVKAAVEKAAAEQQCTEGTAADATPEQVLAQMQAMGEAAAMAFVEAMETPEEQSADATVEEEQGQDVPTVNEEELPMHEGIWCDTCGTHPIRGALYWKQLSHDTFDLCQGCYEQLGDEEKAELALKDGSVGQVATVVSTEAPEAVGVEPQAFDSMDSAMEAIGLADDSLSASIMAEIEHAVMCNAAEAAEKAEAEAEAAAAAEAEAKAMAEAAAAAAAEAEAAAAAAAAEAEAAAAAEAKAMAEAAAAEAEAEAAAAAAAAEAEAAAVAAAAAAEKAAADAEAAAQARQVRTTLLVEMGFTEAQAAAALDATQGSLERAAEWLFVEAVEEFPAAPAEAAFPAEWTGLLRDLLEMGFEEASSKEALTHSNGDLKAAVKALVDMERRAD